MLSKLARRAALGAVLAASMSVPTFAEFRSPDWSGFSIEGVSEPDWIAGVRDGDYIGMCVSCAQTMMLQVQVLRDDGTGERVRSGVTTAQSYTQLGQANAARLGGEAAYYGTEEIAFASAIGFKTEARGATGDYSSTYQLWGDGQQLLVRVHGADQAEVAALAERTFAAAAPLTFR